MITVDEKTWLTTNNAANSTLGEFFQLKDVKNIQ